MTRTAQFKPDACLPDIFPNNDAVDKSPNDDLAPAGGAKRALRAQRWWTAGESGVWSPFVVEGLFGKRHWAVKWVLELCQADHQFALHLAEQSRGYAHYVCVVRLELLKRDVDDEESAEYADAFDQAERIRCTRKKKMLQNFMPPRLASALINLLPKLPDKPLAQKDYRQLLADLWSDSKRKRFRHAKRVKKCDIHLAGMSERLPDKFRSGDIMRCINSIKDYDEFCMLVRAAQILGLKMSEQAVSEINRIARKEKDMDSVSIWFDAQFAKLPFPPPPWDGNPYIRPVRSHAELNALGQEFQNCLTSGSHGREVVLRRSYFYACQRTPAVIQLESDVLFGWTLNEIQGFRNRKIPDVQHNKISQAFMDQNIFWSDYHAEHNQVARRIRPQRRRRLNRGMPW